MTAPVTPAPAKPNIITEFATDVVKYGATAVVIVEAIENGATGLPIWAQAASSLAVTVLTSLLAWAKAQKGS